MKRITIENDTFQCFGFVFFDCRLREATNWCHKNLKEIAEGLREKFIEFQSYEEGDEPGGITLSSNGNFAIWLSKNPYESNAGLEILVHEASHAAMKIVKHYSIDPLEKSGDEILAVLTEYVVRQVMKNEPKKHATKKK